MVRRDPERTLYLAILAQAVADVLDEGVPDEVAESAWMYLSGHAKILNKIQRLSPEAKAEWLKKLREVLNA